MLTFAECPIRHVVTTRWSDNDMYGHVNNAVYYAYFDAAINTWLAQALPTTFEEMPVMGVVAESGCRFLAPVSFPGEVTVGLRITRLGRSSVTYQLGVFAGSDPQPGDAACAVGHWVHVYVERESGSVCEIPGYLREHLNSACVVDDSEPTGAGAPA